MKALSTIVLAATLALVGAAPAGAHAIHIYAWPEGGQVCANAHESDEEKVVGGQVAMLGPDGATLAEGVTDDNGDVCFPAPEVAGDLVFRVAAEGGHQAEFKLSAARRSAEAASEPESRITAKDVIGGLGWLVGFVGAYMWMKNRRRRKGE